MEQGKKGQIRCQQKKMSAVYDVDRLTKENQNFRKVLSTPGKTQIVLMSLLPMEEIGLEVHRHTDQLLKIVQGYAQIILNEKTIMARKGALVVVQHGTKHNIINASKTKRLQLYSMYSPPEHPKQLTQKKKPSI